MQLDPRQIPTTLMQPATDAGQPAAPAAGEVTQRLMHLRALFAEMDDRIQREAEERAAELIEDAEARAQLAITEARTEVQHEKDVSHELRRCIRAAGQYRDDVNRYRDRLAAALGRHPSTPWLSLVAEIETRLKKSTDA